MTTRSASEFDAAEPKHQAVQTRATESTTLYYYITVNCLKCSRSTSVKVDRKLIPDEVMHLLLSIRWDDKNWPISEIGRPILNDPDDIKKKLMLQALIEKKEQYTFNEEGTPKLVKNTCIIPDVLEDFDFDTKKLSKLGLLSALNEITQKHIDTTVAKHDEVLGPNLCYYPADSIVNYLSFSVLEEWIDTEKKVKK